MSGIGLGTDLGLSAERRHEQTSVDIERANVRLKSVEAALLLLRKLLQNRKDVVVARR